MGSRGRGARGASGEHLRRSSLLGLHVHLCKLEIGQQFVVVEEWALPLNKVSKMSEAFVQAVQDIENGRSITDRLVEVSKLICDGLQAAAVFSDAHVALDGGAELGVKCHGASLAVAEKLLLEAKPDETSGRRASARLETTSCSSGVMVP